MPNLNELLSEKQQQRRRSVSPALKKELSRRSSKAQFLATQALIRLHRADYDDLYEQAKAKVEAESGPLPE